MSKPFRILSLDGGGVRGIGPTRILHHIEEELTKKLGTPTKIHDYFDLIVGTSTGGLIGLGLSVANENTPTVPKFSLCNWNNSNSIGNLYMKELKTVFYDQSIGLDSTTSGLDSTRTQVFESLLKRTSNFRNSKTKKEMSFKYTDFLIPIILCSYDISNHEPFFFNSARIKKGLDQNRSIWKAARAISAGPAFFDPMELPHEDKTQSDRYLIDGGVHINNPAVYAVSEVLANPVLYGRTSVNLGEIEVLSLSCGKEPTTLLKEQNTPSSTPFNPAYKWGYKRAFQALGNTAEDNKKTRVLINAAKIVPSLARTLGGCIKGSSAVNSKVASNLLGNNHVRIEYNIPAPLNSTLNSTTFDDLNRLYKTVINELKNPNSSTLKQLNKFFSVNISPLPSSYKDVFYNLSPQHHATTHDFKKLDFPGVYDGQEFLRMHIPISTNWRNRPKGWVYTWEASKKRWSVKGDWLILEKIKKDAPGVKDGDIFITHIPTNK